MREPGAVEVGGAGVVALVPVDSTRSRQLLQVFTQPGRDDAHHGALVEKGPDPARGHGATADGDDEAAGEVEHHRQRGLQISHASSPSGSVGAAAVVGRVAPTMPAATVRPSWASMSRK